MTTRSREREKRLRDGRLVRRYEAVEKYSDGAFFITTNDVDHYQDRVAPEGADLSVYLKNPVVLWIHDAYGFTGSHGLPVATSTGLKMVPGRGIQCVGLDWLQGDEFADRVRNAWEQGKVRGASIGFIPLEYEENDVGGYDISRWKMLEFSLCPIPANPAAVKGRPLDAREAAMAIKRLGGDPEAIFLATSLPAIEAAVRLVKAVPEDVSKVKADEATAWSAPSLGDFTAESWDALSDAERRRIAGHYAWARELPPATFGDLKLPHHEAKGGQVVWAGVSAAMGVLLGARGGADIPESERRAVYDHLAAHYGQFDKPVPDFKDVVVVIEGEDGGASPGDGSGAPDPAAEMMARMEAAVVRAEGAATRLEAVASMMEGMMAGDGSTTMSRVRLTNAAPQATARVFAGDLRDYLTGALRR